MPAENGKDENRDLSDCRGLILLLVASLALLYSFSRPWPVVERFPVLPAAQGSGGALFSLVRFERIDINRADFRTLTAIPGIGPVRARAILDLRKKNGPLAVLADLAQIPGIGKKTVRDLAAYLKVERDGDLSPPACHDQIDASDKPGEHIGSPLHSPPGHPRRQ